jgi:surface polysaccharide O-acyltransferase-like enzyme
MYNVRQSTILPQLQNRNIYIDLLRILATFGVIIIHVASSKWYDTSIETFDWQIINFYHSVVRWPVPIFFMISGIFLLRPLNNDVEFKQEMKYIFKKILRLVCSIVFWVILYNFFALFLGKFIIGKEFVDLHDILKAFGRIILGPAWFHLWFVYALIGLYLLIPILRCFIKNSKKIHLKYYLILFFVFGIFLPTCNTILEHISILKGNTVYLPLPEMTGYMGYFVAGYYFANYEIRKKTKVLIYILAVLSLLSTVIGTLVIPMYTKYSDHYLIGLFLSNTMFIAFGVFFIFQWIDKKNQGIK